MDCCENENITCKDCENTCINGGTIHDYKYVNEISFKDYNMNMLNMLFYKKTIYERKNIYIINVFTLKKLMKTQYYFLIIHRKKLENYII